MKKLNLILGILIGLTILSCSSDDENNGNDGNNGNDLIVGTWHPDSEKKVIDGVEQTLDWTCGEFTTYSFMENGEYTTIIFALDNDNNCAQITNSDIYGNWENIGNGVYKLTTIYEDVNTSETQTSVEQFEIIFTNNNNTMTTYYQIDPNENNYTISTTFTRAD